MAAVYSRALRMFIRSHEAMSASCFRRLVPGRLRSAAARVITRHCRSELRFPDLPVGTAVPSAYTVAPAAEPSNRGPGVNVYGFFSRHFGLAESARLYAQAFTASGLSVNCVDLPLEIPHALSPFGESELAPSSPHSTDFIVANPDVLDSALQFIGEPRPNAYRMGCWFWELDRAPLAWLPALAHVDEVVVASSYVERAWREVTDKPVFRLPLPLTPRVEAGLGREEFGLPRDKFLFLAVFDFHSTAERKNPEAVIRAFLQAFGGGVEPVALLIKTVNGSSYPEALMRLIAATAGDERILIRDELLSPAQLASLQRCADAFVSLHRAEGFGLGLAECMGRGKPVIATNYSGNTDFMTEDNSCLVQYRLVPVSGLAYPHATGHWAEPDVGDAARHMLRLFENPAFAVQLGARAARDIHRQLSPERVAAMFRERLETIASQRTKRSH